MTAETNNSQLLELAPAELIVPLKATHAGRTFHLRHLFRPPTPADWFAYEAALQLAIEELPAPSGVEGDSDEPAYRLCMRSTDAALELWARLIARVEGYAFAPEIPAGSSSGHDFSERSRSAAETPVQVYRGGDPEPRTFGAEGSRAVQVGTPTCEGPASRLASRPAGQVGGTPEETGHIADWRARIPVAHKEAAIRALTLVAPARLPVADPGAADSNGHFPLYADEVPVVLEAAVGGHAYPRLIHRFRPPSVAVERAYRRLLAESLIVRGSRIPRTLIPARLPALARLYDQLIVGVEGYSVQGQPLASSLQAIQHMDAWHKRVAIQTLFGDLSAESPDERAAAAPPEAPGGRVEGLPAASPRACPPEPEGRRWEFPE